MSGLDFSKLGETKVTVPAILLVFLLIIGWNAKDFTIAGLDEFFFTDAAAEELSKQINKNTEVLTDYIRRQEIRDVNDQLVQIDTQVTETQLWIAANGDNPIATARLADLVQRSRTLGDRKACLLNDNVTDKEDCDA